MSCVNHNTFQLRSTPNQKETMSLKTWTCIVDNKAYIVTADDVTMARALLLREGATVYNKDLVPCPTTHRRIRVMSLESTPVEVVPKADKDLQETFDAACEALADLEEVLRGYTKQIETFNGTGLQDTNATNKLKFAKAILAIQRGVN